MGFYTSVEISATGLSAERLAMDVIANNIANAQTTRTPEGGPFKRQLIVFSQKADPTSVDPQNPQRVDQGQNPGTGGVQAVAIIPDPGPDKMVYDPTHPDADSNGYVHYPNIDIMKEMVDMMAASRAYEANVSAIQDVRTTGTAVLGLLQA